MTKDWRELVIQIFKIIGRKQQMGQSWTFWELNTLIISMMIWKDKKEKRKETMILEISEVNIIINLYKEK